MSKWVSLRCSVNIENNPNNPAQRWPLTRMCCGNRRRKYWWKRAAKVPQPPHAWPRNLNLPGSWLRSQQFRGLLRSLGISPQPGFWQNAQLEAGDPNGPLGKLVAISSVFAVLTIGTPLLLRSCPLKLPYIDFDRNGLWMIWNNWQLDCDCESLNYVPFGIDQWYTVRTRDATIGTL